MDSVFMAFAMRLRSGASHDQTYKVWDIHNNLVSHNLMPRNGATADLQGNVTDAQASWFEDATAPNLHLLPTASSAVDQGVSLAAGVCDHDYDGEPRDSSPDVGADEVVD